MSKVIIIDDELDSCELIEYHIKQHCPSLKLMGIYTDPSEGLVAIKNAPPDLLFLDIKMPSMSGFDLLNSLEEIPFEVIFITAYDEYALNAFKFSAIDYICKPFSKQEFVEGVRKFHDRRKTGLSSERLETLIAKNNKAQVPLRISLPTSDGLVFIYTNEIVRCESDANYTNVFMLDGKMHLVTRTLKEFENLLCNFHFVRVHNSHIINIYQIETYTKGDGGSVRMADGIDVYISKRKKTVFLEKLKRMSL